MPAFFNTLLKGFQFCPRALNINSTNLKSTKNRNFRASILSLIVWNRQILKTQSTFTK